MRSRLESERLVRKLCRQVILATLTDRSRDGEEGIDFRNLGEVGKKVFSIEDSVLRGRQTHWTGCLGH